MEEQVNKLVDKIWKKFQTIPKSKRLLIGIAGIPGSGKTTLAATIVSRLNALFHELAPGSSNGFSIAAFIPMDGYHLSRAQLDALPDPTTAHARRGAEFTFDGASFLKLVQEARKPLAPETATFYAPSFDHAIKDPVANDIAISPSMRILVFEGNYISLDKEPWREAAALMDELWFVDVDFEVARERLVSRHVKAGIAEDEDAAHKRVTENDLVNGKVIVDGRLDVHELVISREDEAWKPQEQDLKN